MAFRKGAIVVLLLAFLCCLDAQTTNTTEPVGTATHLSYKIINRFSHDPSAFTQGLIVQPGNSRYFIEGTGQYRMSQMRRVEIDTGKVVEFYALDSRKFGEGVTFLNGFYYQLTWKSGVVYIYRQVDDMDSDGMLEEQALEFGEPEEIGLLPNPIKQGWGLTTDGEYLILSDGSSTLYWLSEDFEVVKELKVRDEFGKLLPRLNELEFIEGEIWANVWFSTWIYIINPESGKQRKIMKRKDKKTQKKKKKKKKNTKRLTHFFSSNTHTHTHTHIHTNRQSRQNGQLRSPRIRTKK